MVEVDFRLKVIVFLSTVFLVTRVTKNTVFLLLILLLSIYLILLGFYKPTFKAVGVLVFVLGLRLISKGEGFGFFIPEMFLFIITRMIGVLMSVIPILKTAPGEITCILKKYRIHRNLSLPLIFMIRFLPTIKYEFKEIIDNLKLRGLLSWKKPLLLMEYIFMPMMFQAAKTAEEIAAAAEVRGISNNSGYRSRREIRFGRIDFIGLLLCLAGAIFLLLLEGGRI